MRRLLVLALPALTLACGASSDEAQIVYPAGALEAGRIRLVSVATVGSEEMPGVICGGVFGPRRRGGHRVALLPDGGVAVRGCDCGNVILFGAAGEFERILGHCGPGPGELEDFGSLNVGDGELIVTGTPSKMLRHSWPAGDLLGEATLPARASIRGVLPGGLYVLGYAKPATETSMYGLHLHRKDGSYVRSFYEVDTTVDRPAWWAALELVHVIVDDEGFVWTVRAYNRYEIQKWDAEGRLVARFDDPPDWFPAYPGNFNGFRSMIHAAVWRDGRLWLVGQHPATFDPEKLRGLGTLEDTLNGPSEIRDVVQVLDAATGATILSQSYHSLGIWGATRGHFYRTPQDEAGTIRVELLRPELIDG